MSAAERAMETEAERLYAFIWNIVQYGPGRKTRSAALDRCWELTDGRIESKRLPAAVTKAKAFAKRHGYGRENDLRRKWFGGKWIRPERRLALYMRDSFACVWCRRGIETHDIDFKAFERYARTCAHRPVPLTEAKQIIKERNK